MSKDDMLYKMEQDEKKQVYWGSKPLLKETPPNREQQFHAIANEVADLLVKKDADYGHNNIDKFGPKGVLVRLNDKIERLNNFLWFSDKEPNFENLEDTAKDLIGYGIHLLIQLRKER